MVDLFLSAAESNINAPALFILTTSIVVGSLAPLKKWYHQTCGQCGLKQQAVYNFNSALALRRALFRLGAHRADGQEF